MEDRVSRNCSAEPSGTSGLASWASWIFCFSSSVGIIVRIFWGRNGVSWVEDEPRFLPLPPTRCVAHLYALLVEGVLVKVEDGRLDRARRRQHRQPDVDGVAPLGVQNDDLLALAVCCRFLVHRNTESFTAGSPSGLAPFLFPGWSGLRVRIKGITLQVKLTAAAGTIWRVGTGHRPTVRSTRCVFT